MPSRFDDERLEQFFQRLNQPLKRMPQPARAELHAELRQHLDALAAAHEELGSSPEAAYDLALRQFGDPGKIGRKLWWEWFLSSRKGPSEDFRAVLYALMAFLILGPVLYFVLFGLLPLSIAALASPTAGDDFFNAHSGTLSFLLMAGTPILAGLRTGRKYPRLAVRAMFWASVSLGALLLPAIVVASLLLRQEFPPNFLAGFGFMALCGVLSACAAGAHKAGRRRLPLAGFKRRG